MPNPARTLVGRRAGTPLLPSVPSYFWAYPRAGRWTKPRCVERLTDTRGGSRTRAGRLRVLQDISPVRHIEFANGVGAVGGLAVFRPAADFVAHSQVYCQITRGLPLVLEIGSGHVLAGNGGKRFALIGAIRNSERKRPKRSRWCRGSRDRPFPQGQMLRCRLDW